MKEIKFRAWDEIKKVMHNNFQFIKSGEEGNDWIIFTSDKQKISDKPHPFENPYFQQQLKIMQFTGIKDKNGKDIYEGDIVKFYNVYKAASKANGTPCSLHEIDPIIFEEGRFIPKGYCHGSVETWIVWGKKVIGNIYQNPELLEEKEYKNERKISKEDEILALEPDLRL